MSAPPPPSYSAVSEVKPDLQQYPVTQPPPMQPQPYVAAPQPQNPQQWYPPAPQPQPQPYPPQPQQYPPPPAAYYQPQPAPTVVVATGPMAMSGAYSMFPPDPMQTTCPNCQQSILTRTTYELGTLVWVIAAMLCIIGCFIVAWIPCVIDGCKDVVHTCPSCGAVVGRHQRLGGNGYSRRGRYYY